MIHYRKCLNSELVKKLIGLEHILLSNILEPYHAIQHKSKGEFL